MGCRDKKRGEEALLKAKTLSKSEKIYLILVISKNLNF